jgi:outer membrane protein TolC
MANTVFGQVLPDSSVSTAGSVSNDSTYETVDMPNNTPYASDNIPIDTAYATDNQLVTTNSQLATTNKPSQNLSLKDALQRALSDNPLVKVERIYTDIAASLLKEVERAVYEPVLNADYRTSQNESGKFDRSHNLSVSVAEDLPTGTRIEVGMGASPYKDTDTAKPDLTFQNNIGITVTQALLQGGLGMSANLVPLRKARIDMSLRKEELAAYTQRLIADTESAYWDMLLSGEQMSIYKYSLELAQRLLYESEERLKLGSAAPADLVAIRAEVASRERQLFDAETAYRQKALQLVYLMNAPDLWDSDLVLTDTSVSLGKADAVSDHIDAAHMFRPDYNMAFMLAQKGELDLVQTKNGTLPRLDAFISLGGTSYAESFPAALAPNSPLTGQISGGLTLAYPLMNNSAREKHRRTQFTVEQQKHSIENLARLVEYEIRSAHIEVSRAQRQVETARTVSALQLQKLEAEQARMNAGKSTSYAVLQVQRDVISANLDEAQARTAHISALISLFSKDGTLLQRRGVKMSEP